MKAKDEYSNSYFLSLLCTFMYLKIPINDPLCVEAKGGHYNIQSKSGTQPNCKHLANA